MSPGTFNLVIDNQTEKYSNNEVYIYVIGHNPNSNNVFAWLNASGTLTDAPPSSSPANLPLNASGTTTFTVPYITSGRIWISLGAALIMPFNSDNPPGQIQPSVSNPSDPNINALWDFAEFNFDSTSLFVNTSQVDAFAIPIQLTLDGTVASTPVSVVGVDGAGWTAVQKAVLANPTFSPLVINNANGDFVRVLQPNDGITYGVFDASYLDVYIDSCWTFYQTNEMIMDLTAAGFGKVVGTVDFNSNFNFLTQDTNSLLKIVATIPKPTTQQAFACNGPLATGNDEQQAIQNVIAAGLNRGVLE
ncbi:MAG TPA: beta-1,3-glucanase family protein, partial [Thermoanaerobaculia bacterium]|nr:beta-1,3-glucanase family protein [Thermoanaerobaculia bacterium]